MPPGQTIPGQRGENGSSPSADTLPAARSMKSLWLLFVVVAGIGSLYPFDFDAARPLSLESLLTLDGRVSSRGDVLGNLLLFLPIGWTGALAFGASHHRIGRLAVVCAGCAVLAAALQLAQQLLPSRDPSAWDVVWNSVGGASGALVAGALPPGRDLEGGSIRWRVDGPTALLALWVAYRLFPFVPSIDLQLVKDSLKPLLHSPLDPVDCLRDAVGWVVAAYLMQSALELQRVGRVLAFAVVGVMGLEVLIIDNAVDRSDVIGALAAVVIWRLVPAARWRSGIVVSGLLALSIVAGGLAPFAARPHPVPFQWVPFQGFLGGSMYVNVQSALEKSFLYGALVLALWRTPLPRGLGTLAACALVGGVEFAQVHFSGHSPEITDPLLVALAATALRALERDVGGGGPEDAARAR